MTQLTVGELRALLEEYPDHHHVGINVPHKDAPVPLSRITTYCDAAGPMVVLS